MKLWVDVACAPQATLFRPVVAELHRQGHETVITVWDRGQTKDLALSFWPDALVVGAGFRRPLLDKATAVWSRGRELARRIGPAKPDAAVSHNSYSQIVAGRILRIPTVTAMDYEHQPANHLAFRLAHRVILPEAIPFRAVRRYGCTADRILRYKGLKEDITLSTFRPTPGFRRSIGIEDDVQLITIRPPAEGALYHRGPNEALERLLHRLGSSGSSVMLSPRTLSQAERFASVPGVTVLDRAVSGPDLLFHSDIVIGAGGTMTREAAVLGTKTYTMFKGRRPAVDQYLIDQGHLTVLDRPDHFRPGHIDAEGRRAWAPDSVAVQRFAHCLLRAIRSIRPESRVSSG